MLWIEFDRGDALPWQVEALQDSVITQVPDFNRAVRRTRGDPFAVRALSNSVDCLGVLSQRRHALLLPLIPHSYLRIRTARKQIRVAHRRAQGGARGIMSSERSNFCRLFDVPRLCLSGYRTREQLANCLTEDH